MRVELEGVQSKTHSKPAEALLGSIGVGASEHSLHTSDDQHDAA